MFYKPKFCCQCGEKIDGVMRKFWTSRRFCELCATEFGLYERIPQFVGGIFLLFGLFGIGIYLQKPEKPLGLLQNQVAASNVKVDLQQSKNVAQVSTVRSVQETVQPGNLNTQISAQDALTAKANLKVGTVPGQSVPTEKVYFCGALTKKGTMCSRRIKSGGRCWQHEGQSAMLSQEKLIAVR